MGVDGTGDGLLHGVRVLDLSIWRPGPYATQLLAELGADVIKIEPPGGDPMRAYAGLFATLHAGKRSLVLDLKDEVDRVRALHLAADTDVVVEGFRPGVADRLGVGVEHVRAVNPEAVYCSVSGYGQTGPLAAVPGHDLDYVAWAGVLAPDGGAPRLPAIPVADLAGGMAAAFAISAALVRRLRTGEGERIDLAMADVLATWTGVDSPVATGLAADVRGVPGYGTFETADGGWIALGVVSEDHFWRALCRCLDLDAVAPLGFVERVEQIDELQEAIARAVRRQRRDELVETLLAADVPVAPVLSRAEMAEADHLRVRGAVVGAPDDARPATGVPIRFVHHPAVRPATAPALDQHRGASWFDRSGPLGGPSGGASGRGAG